MERGKVQHLTSLSCEDGENVKAMYFIGYDEEKWKMESSNSCRKGQKRVERAAVEKGRSTKGTRHIESQRRDSKDLISVSYSLIFYRWFQLLCRLVLMSVVFKGTHNLISFSFVLFSNGQCA